MTTRSGLLHGILARMTSIYGIMSGRHLIQVPERCLNRGVMLESETSTTFFNDLYF